MTTTLSSTSASKKLKTASTYPLDLTLWSVLLWLPRMCVCVLVSMCVCGLVAMRLCVLVAMCVCTGCHAFVYWLSCVCVLVAMHLCVLVVMCVVCD